MSFFFLIFSHHVHIMYRQLNRLVTRSSFELLCMLPTTVSGFDVLYTTCVER